MATKYFRKKEPNTEGSEVSWIEMTGQEFYAFVNSPQAEGRRFIFMDDDLVIESNEQQFREWIAEKNHSDYLRRCECGIKTVSLYSDDLSESGNGEDVLSDLVDIEDQVVMNLRCQMLRTVIEHLDDEDKYFVKKLFLNEKPVSEFDLSVELGITRQAVNKRKKKLLKNLKNLVAKSEKSQQYKVRGKNKGSLT